MRMIRFFAFFFSLICVCGNAAESYPAGSVRALLIDIEGTISSPAFSKNILCPYAEEHFREYVSSHLSDPEVYKAFQQARKITGRPFGNVDSVLKTLEAWFREGKKCAPLSLLLTKVWEQGYTHGDIQGHLYRDAYLALRAWRMRAIPLYVYSSQCEAEQRLLLFHSMYGNLASYFEQFFDPSIGKKTERSSYLAAAEAMGLEPSQILFLSDSRAELKAAESAGMQVLMICRDGAIACPSLRSAASFEDIDLQ